MVGEDDFIKFYLGTTMTFHFVFVKSIPFIFIMLSGDLVCHSLWYNPRYFNNTVFQGMLLPNSCIVCDYPILHMRVNESAILDRLTNKSIILNCFNKGICIALCVCGTFSTLLQF